MRMHTSYNDVLKLTPLERKYLLDSLAETNREMEVRQKELLEKNSHR